MKPGYSYEREKAKSESFLNRLCEQVFGNRQFDTEMDRLDALINRMLEDDEKARNERDQLAEELAAERKRVARLTEQLDIAGRHEKTLDAYRARLKAELDVALATKDDMRAVWNASMDRLKAENLSLRAELDQARGELQDAKTELGWWREDQRPPHEIRKVSTNPS